MQHETIFNYHITVVNFLTLVRRTLYRIGPATSPYKSFSSSFILFFLFFLFLRLLFLDLLFLLYVPAFSSSPHSFSHSLHYNLIIFWAYLGGAISLRACGETGWKRCVVIVAAFRRSSNHVNNSRFDLLTGLGVLSAMATKLCVLGRFRICPCCGLFHHSLGRSRCLTDARGCAYVEDTGQCRPR